MILIFNGCITCLDDFFLEEIVQMTLMDHMIKICMNNTINYYVFLKKKKKKNLLCNDLNKIPITQHLIIIFSSKVYSLKIGKSIIVYEKSENFKTYT